MRGARAALTFLTRLPAGTLAAEDFAAAPGWFAAVGLLIGAVQAAVFALAAPVWGPALAALAALGAGIAMTGALHEDGLADTCDGLGPRVPADRALEIMRDPRIGAFGALGLGLVLAAGAMTLARLGPAAPAALIAGQALSRAAMTGLLRAGPYLRAQGAGAGMTGRLGPAGLAATGAAVAAALVLSGAGHGAAVLAGLAGLAIGAGAVWVWARSRLGGVTGDILGAAQQAGCLGFWLGVLGWL